MPFGLIKRDLPQKSSNLECWYFTGHFDGKCTNFANSQISNFSIFICFSRFKIESNKYNDSKYVHSMKISLYDKTKQKMHYYCVLDKRFAKTEYDRISNKKNSKSFFEKEYENFLKHGIIPKPDILAINDTKFGDDKLFIQIDQNILTKDFNGNYCVTINTKLYQDKDKDNDAVDCNLMFKPYQNGNIHIIHQNDQYSVTNLAIFGSIDINDEIIKIMDNSNNKGCYDHKIESISNISNVNSIFIQLQLDNNIEIQCSSNNLIFVDSNGIQHIVDKNNYNISFETKEEELFVSSKTFNKYHTDLILEIHGIAMGMKPLKLNIKHVFDKLINCEIVDISLQKIMWLSPINVAGDMNGRGFYKIFSKNLFDSFNETKIMKNISDYLCNIAVHSIYPKIDDFAGNHKHLAKLMTLPGFECTDYNDLDIKVLHKNLLNPAIELIKQKGKGWRSFGCIISGNIANNKWNPTQTFLQQLIALQELPHVGSLIIDDIQDNSSTRRGTECVHIKYDLNTAINCGNAAFNLSEFILRDNNLSEKQQYLIYQQVFRCYRGAWIGQTLDCVTLDYMMDGICNANDMRMENVDLAINRLQQIHSLKTGIPASCGACIGAISSKPDITQNELKCIANYFENLGTSFQIIDDVKNLLGVFMIGDNKNKLSKNIGEDIIESKVTFPILYAMKLIKNKNDKINLWTRIKKCDGNNLDELRNIIKIINDCGAITCCKNIATEQLTKSTKQMYQVFGASYYTILLVAFSHLLLNHGFTQKSKL